METPSPAADFPEDDVEASSEVEADAAPPPPGPSRAAAAKAAAARREAKAAREVRPAEAAAAAEPAPPSVPPPVAAAPPGKPAVAAAKKALPPVELPRRPAASPFSAAMSIATVLAVAGALGGALWSVSGPLLRSQPQYRVSAEQVVATPQPEWVKADVRREALHQSGLDEGFSILEPRIAERIAQTFALHPWVAGVDAVRLQFPSRVDVLVRYRQPVVMVEVPGGLYPVDAQGVLLPSADFTSERAGRYPRLTGVVSTPGPVGTVWKDPVLLGGASLAAELAPTWESLRLFRLAPMRRDPLEAPDSPGEFELETVAGRTRIRWGHPPSKPDPREAETADKLSRLKHELSRRGDWDHGSETTLDLRPRAVAQAPMGHSPDEPANAEQPNNPVTVRPKP